jgi:hypothetical protein
MMHRLACKPQYKPPFDCKQWLAFEAAAAKIIHNLKSEYLKRAKEYLKRLFLTNDKYCQVIPLIKMAAKPGI